MGAEVCAKTCSKRYVPKQPLDTSDLVTGRDGNAGDGNAFQQQLATIFADETIARISKGKWQMATHNCAPRLVVTPCRATGVLEIPPAICERWLHSLPQVCLRGATLPPSLVMAAVSSSSLFFLALARTTNKKKRKRLQERFPEASTSSAIFKLRKDGAPAERYVH